MLKTKKINKILSIILLVLTIFSIAQPIFAASGTGQWTGGQYDSRIKTTDNQNGSTGVLIRRLINNNTNEKRLYFVLNMELILQQVQLIMENIIHQLIVE